MRGDRPYRGLVIHQGPAFTPHARGSTPTPSYPHGCGRVYPACAGIDPVCLVISYVVSGLPRMRGDRPPSSVLRLSVHSFTPHARGSTALTKLQGNIANVYPACAGIDPISPCFESCLESLPRMRGDRPDCGVSVRSDDLFTPHARGSTLGI